MIGLPGPVRSLPSLEIGGALVGPSNIYVFFLGGVAGLYVVWNAICYNQTQILFPRSMKYILAICFAILASSYLNADFTLGTLTELFQWVGLALLVALVANFVRSTAEIRLLLGLLVYVALFKAAFVVANLLIFGVPIYSYGTVVMGMGLLTTLVLLFNNGVTKGRIAGALFLIFPIAVSNDRKGIVGIVVAILAMRVWWHLSAKKELRVSVLWPVLGLTVAVGVFFTVLVSPLQSATFGALEQFLRPFSQPRYHLYQTGLEMFGANPLLGVGPENWHVAKPVYSTPGLSAVEGTKDWGAHSYYLKILAELGLAGFVPLALLVMLPFKQASHYITQSQLNQDLWAVVFSFCVYFSIYSLVSSISKPLQVGWFITFGLAGGLARLSRTTD